MARTITTNAASGVTLTNTGDSPVTIASGVSIGGTSGIGLRSSQAFFWDVTDEIAAAVTGDTFGVSLASAGTVRNSGTVVSSFTAGLALSSNTIVSAALFVGGGGVSNSVSGTVTGGLVGVGLGGAGSVVNAGSIRGGSPAVSGGYGVALVAGGTVTNQSGGSIYGSRYGVYGNGALSVTNQPGAAIGSADRGIASKNGAGNATVGNQGTVRGGQYGVIVNGLGTVINQGSIVGTTVAGVFLTAGGTVANTGASASILGGYDAVAVYGAPGTVSNQGTIRNTVPEYKQTGAFGGVLLNAGGSIGNTGLIAGTYYGAIVRGGTGTIANQGTILSTGTLFQAGTYTRRNPGAGAVIGGGGFLTNASGAFIAGGWVGAQSGRFTQAGTAAAVTIDNAGVIQAADGKGNGAALWINGPGLIVNRASGAIGVAVNNTIVGGPLNGLRNGGFGIVAYYQTTLINYGFVGASQYAFTASNRSPTNTISNLIEMAPGASFGGVVKGANGRGSARLELLSGATTGTVKSFGTVTANGSSYSGYLGFGTIQIDNGARWSLGGTVAAGKIVSFASGGTGRLTLNNPAAMQGTIVGFGPGETLTLAGITAASGVSLSPAGNLLTVNGTGVTLQFDPSQSFAGFSFSGQVSGGAIDIGLVPCFAAGTRIQTDNGPLAVEHLREGMRVATHRGAPAEIVWIGTRAINCSTHPRPAAVWPVRVRAGAFGRGKPSRDLFLSPDHAVFADGVLIPIQHLCNGRTIQQIEVARVTYYHVELPEHAVILAEDLPVESYLDTGDRANFRNGDGPVRLHPDFSAKVWEMEGCAP